MLRIVSFTFKHTVKMETWNTETVLSALRSFLSSLPLASW